MFRLIPLRSLARTAHHRVEDVFPVDITDLSSVQREIIAPNGTSPCYNDLPRSWNMTPDKSNTLLLTSGTLELVLYSLRERKQESLVLTPENVHLNGKLYYGSPVMIKWSPHIFYKMRADSDGCTFVTFISDDHQVHNGGYALDTFISDDDKLHDAVAVGSSAA